MPVLASIGKDFSTFLLNRQVYIKNVGAQEKLRSYLMDYLTMVQQQTPTGLDFTSFGWQKDGSFLCGDMLLGSDTTDMRLRGNAAIYGSLLGRVGTRDEWVRGMALLDNPGSENVSVYAYSRRRANWFRGWQLNGGCVYLFYRVFHRKVVVAYRGEQFSG